MKAPPTQRQLRVGEEIRHILAEVFRREEMYDTRKGRTKIDLRAVTVSEVRISPDLKNATAYITVLSGEGTEAMAASLNAVVVEVRAHMGKMLRAKFTPRLQFRPDTSFETASRIEALFHSPAVRRDLEPKEGE